MADMAQLLSWFYRQPPQSITVVVIWGLLILWLVRRSYGATVRWKLFCLLGLAAGILVILVPTVLGRGSADAQLPPELIPFHTYRAVLNGARLEILRMNYMNTVLVFPAGFFFCELLPGKWKPWQRGILAVCCLGLLCCGIEYCQFRFALGQAEIDDAIHNTLGALLGVLANEILRIACGKESQ